VNSIPVRAKLGPKSPVEDTFRSMADTGRPCLAARGEDVRTLKKLCPKHCYPATRDRTSHGWIWDSLRVDPRRRVGSGSRPSKCPRRCFLYLRSVIRPETPREDDSPLVRRCAPHVRTQQSGAITSSPPSPRVSTRTRRTSTSLITRRALRDLSADLSGEETVLVRLSHRRFFVKGTRTSHSARQSAEHLP